MTSFDWHPKKLEYIFTASIDTTCSIWDITKGSIVNQLIAHDKEVFDVNASPDANEFATVGADGSLRQFDTRDLTNSFILYETTEALLRVAWNRLNPNLIAFISVDQLHITIVDVRRPFHAAYSLYYHEKQVNGIKWSTTKEYNFFILLLVMLYVVLEKMARLFSGVLISKEQR